MVSIMLKINCWEYKECGREPGGKNERSLGICPAATLSLADGFNGGKNGGRACAYISGTFCSGIIQGTHKEKEKNCIKCDFYKILKIEHPLEMNVLKFHQYIQTKEESVIS